MDAEDLVLLATSVAAAIDSDATAPTNDDALGQLGWSDMLVAEPVAAMAVVFGQLGRAAAASTVLDDAVGHAIGLSPGAALVHPEWATAALLARGDLAHLQLAGTAARSRIAERATVQIVMSDGVATVDATSVDLLDGPAESGLARVDVDGPVTDWTSHDPWLAATAITAARRAQAHQLHGLASGMLDLATEHARERMQFGRPIGSFQAVRHKLAETHVAVEAAGDALAANDEDDEADGLVVDLARVLSGRAAQEAGRHCQQVLAGIGFTRDHRFHRYLFAAIDLDGLYGTTAGLTKTLGQQLIADRTVPRVIDL
ncbi:MAG: acyl-CoA dehydrogenase family protein [Acidimicrobiales bacterium]|nr:acyl-CoA dehydrogenase family protein [Acidimicrobiales bacterium]